MNSNYIYIYIYIYITTFNAFINYFINIVPSEDYFHEFLFILIKAARHYLGECIPQCFFLVSSLDLTQWFYWFWSLVRCCNFLFSFLLLFSHSICPDSLWPHGMQHARLPCPSQSPRVCSNSCPLSQRCHPTTSSSVLLFSSYLQSFQWIFRTDFL